MYKKEHFVNRARIKFTQLFDLQQGRYTRSSNDEFILSELVEEQTVVLFLCFEHFKVRLKRFKLDRLELFFTSEGAGASAGASPSLRKSSRKSSNRPLINKNGKWMQDCNRKNIPLNGQEKKKRGRRNDSAEVSERGEKARCVASNEAKGNSCMGNNGMASFIECKASKVTVSGQRCGTAYIPSPRRRRRRVRREEEASTKPGRRRRKRKTATGQERHATLKGKKRIERQKKKKLHDSYPSYTGWVPCWLPHLHFYDSLSSCTGAKSTELVLISKANGSIIELKLQLIFYKTAIRACASQRYRWKFHASIADNSNIERVTIDYDGASIFGGNERLSGSVDAEYFWYLTGTFHGYVTFNAFLTATRRQFQSQKSRPKELTQEETNLRISPHYHESINKIMCINTFTSIYKIKLSVLSFDEKVSLQDEFHSSPDN
ncbi:hypothetical protein WN51_11096 [Melipona quadrifasciata]|uniref:Uncharacterized protein n=1 Tax=Melipona quadrifasciata TaxID=166423 RepID=A0A0M9A6B5_9HYME|nr:hypothetical protein WN51_11096 [Melipona quadrifasciata]